MELVRRRLQQRFEEPHASPQLEDAHRLARGRAERVGLVRRQRARPAVQDRQHAEVDLLFPQRRDGEEASAGSQIEKWMADTLDLASGVLDHIELRRQREARHLRGLDSQARLEPEPAAPAQRQHRMGHIARARHVPDELVRLRSQA